MRLAWLLLALILAGCVAPENGSRATVNPAIVVCILAICEQEDADQSGSGNDVGQAEGAKTGLKLTPM